MHNELTKVEKISFSNTLLKLEKPPVIIIEPQKISLLHLKRLWDYRELCLFFVWRDLTVRYRQTLLGIVWAIIQPLFTMFILSYTVGNLLKIASDDIPYPIFFYSALVLWAFFSNSVINASTSLTGEVNLITKVYFPRLILVASKIITNLVDLGLSLIVLGFMGIIFQFVFSWKFILIPVLFVLLIIFTFSLGMLLAAINVIYRDVRYALPYIIQVLFFLSPIIFPLSVVPKEQQWLLRLNPLVGIIEGFRASLFNHSLDVESLVYSLVLIPITFFLSFYCFAKLEKIFAERI